jgi:hypothetical protein
MTDRDTIAAAVTAARTFIKRAHVCLRASKIQYSKESAAMRRSSMELTRALAEMRKPG